MRTSSPANITGGSSSSKGDCQNQGYTRTISCFPLLNPLLNFLTQPTTGGHGHCCDVDACHTRRRTKQHTELNQSFVKPRPTLTFAFRNTHDTAPSDDSGSSNSNRSLGRGCVGLGLVGAWIRPSSTKSFNYYFSDDDDHDEVEEYGYARPELNATALHKDIKLGGGTYGQVHVCRHDKSNSESDISAGTGGATCKYYALKIQDATKKKRQHEIEQEIEMMLQLGDHPFTCSLYNVYHVKPQEQVALNGKNDSMYTLNCMVMDAYKGGELFHKIHPKDKPPSEHGLEERLAQFYAANIWEAIRHLHSHNIAYRDLKPENFLLDNRTTSSGGYCHLIDFGFAKYLPSGETCKTFCGTPLYLAPEVLKRKGYDKTADIWSFGVLVFEMLTGQTPFCQEKDELHMTKRTLYRTILRGKFHFPPNTNHKTTTDNNNTITTNNNNTKKSLTSCCAQDFVRKLLVVQPHKRLGAKNAHDIQSHPWLATVSRSELLAKSLVPPTGQS
jgi:serine/threonine protein kinase